MSIAFRRTRRARLLALGATIGAFSCSGSLGNENNPNNVEASPTSTVAGSAPVAGSSPVATMPPTSAAGGTLPVAGGGAGGTVFGGMGGGGATGIAGGGTAGSVTTTGGTGASGAGEAGMCAGGAGCGGAMPVPQPPWPPDLSYAVTGQNLLDPALNIPFVQNSANFWTTARDDTNGGFYSFVAADGSPSDDTDKWFVGQSRDGYGFVRAFMLTGNEAYLDQARHALDFLYEHAWDEANGGWFDWGYADGTPQDPGEDKWSFNQHYALLGPTVMCEATRDPLDCDWMHRGLQLLDDKLWDNNARGYFNYADANFSNPRDKGFTPTADGITTNALYTYLVTDDPARRDRFLELADLLANRLVASMDRDDVVFGLAEEYNTNWEVNTLVTSGFVGHMFKTAWCLGRAYLIEPKEEYRAAAQRVLDHMYNDGGFDRDVGAPNDSFEWNMGVTGWTKEFWQVEQGFTSGLINFYIADNNADAQARYLEMGDRSLNFMMTKLVDTTYGDIFTRANEAGTEIIDDAKGGTWKAAYHGIETAYYGYLYGNLMYLREPVSLYYRFLPQDGARTLKLTPLAFQDSRLKIASVTLDGQPFTAFDRDARTLTLDSGVGGIFYVTFERIDVE